jgi:hypothetical protein
MSRAPKTPPPFCDLPADADPNLLARAHAEVSDWAEGKTREEIVAKLIETRADLLRAEAEALDRLSAEIDWGARLSGSIHQENPLAASRYTPQAANRLAPLFDLTARRCSPYPAPCRPLAAGEGEGHAKQHYSGRKAFAPSAGP